MKESGFTLVELLGVIVILSLILMLVFPTVNNILSQSKDTVYQKQINSILSAAYDFSLKNIKYLPEYNQKSYVTLGELKYEGMIDVDIKNPDTNEKFKDNLVISIYNVGASYKNSDSSAKLEGDYLYTLEFDKLNDLSLLPKITLDGLTRNSDGNYILTLDLNEDFVNINYTASSIDGIDLTGKVKKYITLDDSTVDNIDTSKPNIYKINYTVIDDNGYASTSILSVIISDTIAPTIILPENSTINKDITDFDLMEGVICEDNSNYCDITTSGKIDYGVIGKYIITYKAKDPSGNTSTKKRVITIE